MKSLRILFFMALFVFLPQYTNSQTSIDLRTDGRILTGTRKDFLLECIRLHREAIRVKAQPSRTALAMSDSLSNMLLNSNVRAIVVPPGKTGEKYLIGLVIGDDTRLKDFPVTEGDFQTLRGRSSNQLLASVEEKYREIKEAIVNSDSQRMNAELTALRQIVASSNDESLSASLYAGYLLADMSNTTEIEKCGDFVNEYRDDVEKAIDAVVLSRIKERTLAWVTPYKLDDSSEYFTIRNLEGSRVSQAHSTASNPGYIKVWHGRSLVIIPEKPGSPFSAKYTSVLCG